MQTVTKESTLMSLFFSSCNCWWAKRNRGCILPSGSTMLITIKVSAKKKSELFLKTFRGKQVQDMGYRLVRTKMWMSVGSNFSTLSNKTMNKLTCCSIESSLNTQVKKRTFTLMNSWALPNLLEVSCTSQSSTASTNVFHVSRTSSYSGPTSSTCSIKGTYCQDGDLTWQFWHPSSSRKLTIDSNKAKSKRKKSPRPMTTH